MIDTTPPTDLPSFAVEARKRLTPRVEEAPRKPDRYQVVGPTHQTRNLLITCEGRCVATVKYDADRDTECRQIAARLARVESRTLILQHVLAELEADEARWPDEIRMIRDELKVTGDDANT